MVYFVFFTLYCFSTLVCANLVGKGFGKFACFNIRSTFIDAVSWSVQLFLTILFLTGKTYFQRCRLIWSNIVGQWEFSTVDTLSSIKNIKVSHLPIHSHSNVFSHYASFFRNSVLLLIFLGAFLILELNSCKRTNNSRVSPFLVAVIKKWLATWFYNLLLLLGGDVEFNPRPKRNSSNAFSICHWNLNSISVHNFWVHLSSSRPPF